LGCSLGQQGLEEAPMISLFIPATVLLIAMIGSALFGSATRERTDEERGQLMEDIARSYF
jgi:hypothetical protein